MAAAAQGPDPMLIWEQINAYQKTAVLRAAVELELFTRIGEGANTAAALAERCGSSLRGVRIICDFLTVQGLLSKEGDRYSLTPDTAVFLDKKSPAYMGGVLEFLHTKELMSSFENVAEVVRRGTTTLEGAGSVDPEDPVWVTFAKSMVPIIHPAAEFIGQTAAKRGPQRVLDIAAGHGLFGISIAKRNPEAQVTALDWPKVLEVAQSNAASAGVADRYRLLPGDAFQVDFGGPYDTVLLTNFLHHFDKKSCEELLRKVRASLAPDGQAIALEFVPNEDRVSPPVPATFSFVMLCNTPSGDAYTFSELQAMFAAAGFAHSERHDVPQSPETVVVSRLQ